MLDHMSQHEPMYSFGRDRHRASALPEDGLRHVEYPSGHVVLPAEMPPPPAGHRGMFLVVVMYLVTGFMVLWTGASVAVVIEAVGDRDGTQIMVGMFMAAASLAITAGLGAWLIRVHRRRAGYRRILDNHYAQRFGDHPDAM